jgi:hypothetical protein
MGRPTTPLIKEEAPFLKHMSRRKKKLRSETKNDCAGEDQQ